jgi:hypothetical protein
MNLKMTIKIALLVIALFISSCSSDDQAPTEPPQVFTNAHSGFMKLDFTNQFPAFNETAQVDVTIDVYGNVTFGTGTLSYNADDNNGQSRIVRTGTLNLNPKGSHFVSNGEDYIEVDENTTINENMIVYYWDDNSQSWVEMINENINNTWNGGLAFNVADAVLTGSVVQSVTAWGSVTWGLYLVVIP